MSAEAAAEDRPAKRQRVGDQAAQPEGQPASASSAAPQDQKSSLSHAEEQLAKERNAGITELVHPGAVGFSGILKQRYTDFQVHEVAESGTVTHLNTLKVPKRAAAENTDKPQPEPAKTNGSAATTTAVEEPVRAPDPPAEPTEQKTENVTKDENFELSAEHNATLQAIFGEEVVPKIVALYKTVIAHPERKPKDFHTLHSQPIENKEDRTKAHQACRQIFNGKLETQHAGENCIKFMPAPRGVKARGGGFEKNGVRQSGRAGWDDLGGNFLHFNLYKENKDTMEVISFLASQLKVNNKNFQFGGTKDRRAVTVQRCSAYRIRAEQMQQAGRRLNGPTRIGDYSYEKKGMELGEIGGNHFTIALRDCHFPGEESLDAEARLTSAKSIVGDAVEGFRQDGFINYFGLQRFGTFANSTDTVGTKMLQGNLQGAVEDILQFSPDALAAANGTTDPTKQISTDDKSRAKAIDIFQQSSDANKALEILPRKFSAESNIIRYMGQRDRKTGQYPRRNDYQGALQGIPRTLRTMYVHAYQSLVFNVVAGQRLKLYGLKPVEGDLVILPPGSNAAYQSAAGEEVDEQGEVIVRPAADDSAVTEDSFERARPLTAAEAASGKYSIFDVVLPLPGFDVIYPANDSGKVYKSFMASERGGGLDPYDMRRAWKDVSLPGGYRKFLARPGQDISFEVKSYTADEEQLIETDLQRLQQHEEDPIQKKNDAWRQENGYGKASASEDRIESDHEKLAVVLRFSLDSSQYATMALRELMGEMGVRTYKPDFGGGR